MSFPWLREPWLKLLKSAEQQRLAHAYYMRHQPQLGSEQFLLTLANYLLCRQPGKNACGQCKSCLLFKAGNHPDFWQIDATDENSIGIDEVRQLQRKLVQTANQGGARVAVLRPADKLTEQASNAILKVLEEPPAGMFWLLAVEQPEHLLPTLRSRMQWINLALPAKADDGHDELAASLYTSWFEGALPPVIKTKDDAQQWLDISEHLLLDLLATQQGVAASRMHFGSLQQRYRSWQQQYRVDPNALLHAVHECRQLRQRFQQAKGLNLGLLLSLYWQQWAQHDFSSPSGSSL